MAGSPCYYGRVTWLQYGRVTSLLRLGQLVNAIYPVLVVARTGENTAWSPRYYSRFFILTRALAQSVIFLFKDPL